MSDESSCGEEGHVCALCNDYYMGPADDWAPVYLPEEVVRRCVFCRVSRRVAYFTRLGDAVCESCGRPKPSG